MNYLCTYVYQWCLIVVPQLSINGTVVDSVTNTSDEPKFHVKEDVGVLVICIRLENLPWNKTNLTINYATDERASLDASSARE